ncbi:RidA family protein [Georgenia sp. AZ-5]|uniref:RidA family protein n=1 Tax=Georgenia sp. AZ-5 TaxID=3367526 RepID=UPI0037548D69
MSPHAIYVSGLEHGTNPIPAAARRGPLLMTGAVRGVDRAAGALPQDAAEEVRLAFDNLRAVLEAGGGTLDDVVHINVFLGADGIRPLVNESWVTAYPEEAVRPARHVIRQDLPAGMKVQLEATAYIAESGGTA